ncbi:Uncharacterized protein Adt_03581 [Abeliophyllum distichum]|uniref:Uncharacterized protein n=1 Tax=Abeliophyllum distichum TaxID=126358 RepID=A0ABD1W105_9LAMI
MSVSRINIHRKLVDDGSSVNVLHLRTFKKMKIDEWHVRPFLKSLQEGTRDFVDPKGYVTFMVELGLPSFQRRIIADFVIVDLTSNYNAILGRPILHELKEAASIYHYAMKFSTLHGVGIVQRSQTVARSYNITFLWVEVDMLHEDPRCPDLRSEQNELKEEPIEELGRLDPRLNQHEQKVEPVRSTSIILRRPYALGKNLTN